MGRVPAGNPYLVMAADSDWSRPAEKISVLDVFMCKPNHEPKSPTLGDTVEAVTAPIEKHHYNISEH